MGENEIGQLPPASGLSNSGYLLPAKGAFALKEYPRQRVNKTEGMQALVTYQYARDLHPRATKQVGGVFKKAPNKTPSHDV